MTLGEAWADVEAALPEGADVSIQRLRGHWLVCAHPEDADCNETDDDTLPAALRALAVKLRQPNARKGG